MKKIVEVKKEQWECDGCQYLMDPEKPMIVVQVPHDWPIPAMRDGGTVDFHFHALGHRHDCFRYWAHNPSIMEVSLKERGFDQQQVDDFMELMLYRQSPLGPGIERSKDTIGTRKVRP